MNSLSFLYETVIGRAVLSQLIRPGVSKTCGSFLDRNVSTMIIPGFIKNNNIDMNEYEKVEYKSFNQFFCRRIKPENRPIDMSSDSFIAPCDGLLSAYHITDGLVIPVKYSEYSIKDLLRDEKLANRYNGGICLVYRLCVDNYHRYCYPDNGVRGEYRFIKGVLHTVRPIAQKSVPVFSENSREYTAMRTENFGTIIQMEVGAMLVGKIVNKDDSAVMVKGAEKGHFEYGGSTIIQLIQPGKVEIRERIFKQTEAELEVPVKMGQRIGHKAVN